MFGLAAAGTTVGPYVRPLLASMTPPNALVPSSDVLLSLVERSPWSCAGPASAKEARYIMAVRSDSFAGEVLPWVEMPAGAHGWDVAVEPEALRLEPGDRLMFEVRARARSDGAAPNPLPIRIRAVAHPDGGAPLRLGPIAVAPSALPPHFAFVPEQLELRLPPCGALTTDLVLDARCIDSELVGPAVLSVAGVPQGWSVRVGPAALHLRPNGDPLPIDLTVRRVDPDAVSAAQIVVRATIETGLMDGVSAAATIVARAR